MFMISTSNCCTVLLTAIFFKLHETAIDCSVISITLPGSVGRAILGAASMWYCSRNSPRTANNSQQTIYYHPLHQLLRTEGATSALSTSARALVFCNVVSRRRGRWPTSTTLGLLGASKPIWSLDRSCIALIGRITWFESCCCRSS